MQIIDWQFKKKDWLKVTIDSTALDTKYKGAIFSGIIKYDMHLRTKQFTC